VAPFILSGYTLTPMSDYEADPGPKNQAWHKVNVVKVEAIPGAGKEWVTIRTSDKTLWDLTLTIRSVTQKRYQLLKMLCEMGGPYLLDCAHGRYWMYIVDFNIAKDENDKEPPLTEKVGIEGAGSMELNVATWTIKLQEEND